MLSPSRRRSPMDFGMHLLPLIVALSLTTHCADTLLTAEGYPGKPPGGTPLQAGATVALGNGLYETRIDAASYTEWVYFDFEAQNQISAADPLTEANWDLGFQRFKIKLNGGVSGNAGASVVALNGDDFTARSQAPNPFNPVLDDRTDAGDANDACRPTTSGVLYAFLDSTALPNACWFSYSTGVLTPRDVVYVLRTGAVRYFKIKFVSYYGETGTSGKLKFQWGEVAAP